MGAGWKGTKQARTECFCLASLAAERQLDSHALYHRHPLPTGSTLAQFQHFKMFLQAWNGENGGTKHGPAGSCRVCVPTDNTKPKAEPSLTLGASCSEPLVRYTSKRSVVGTH